MSQLNPERGSLKDLIKPNNGVNNIQLTHQKFNSQNIPNIFAHDKNVKIVNQLKPNIGITYPSFVSVHKPYS